MDVNGLITAVGAAARRWRSGMKAILQRIYGRQGGASALARLAEVLNAFAPLPPGNAETLFTEADAVLITYGDTLVSQAELPLRTLNRFAGEHLSGLFSGIHILPFFPYSSDDGFSVTDFLRVRSDLGGWKDVQALARKFKLMVDLVANHVSARSPWFEAFLADEPGFRDMAITVDPTLDLSMVVRPRALPLLTPFTKRSGRLVHVWTTFGSDQIDLNYRSIDVLARMVQILLHYAAMGARMIRLDAIAYLWKTPGTSCIHLPETHDMVRLFRRVLDLKAPDTILITETNVPHSENIRYFGNGGDEAQMVYNFSLPPLLLHALITGRARILSDWAKTLAAPSDRTTFFNFTASHDGIGVRPLEGLLTASQLHRLVDHVQRNGGQVSTRQNPDGSTSPYELNISYLAALKDPSVTPDPFQVARFLASQAVALALPGVPGIYIHSLLGSPNWAEGVRLTGRARTINRATLRVDTVRAELADPTSMRARVFYPYLDLLRVRVRQPAFNPCAGMNVLPLDDRVLALKRSCPRQTLLALTNCSADRLTIALPIPTDGTPMVDLIGGGSIDPARVPLTPYQTRWLTANPLADRDLPGGSDSGPATASRPGRRG